MTKVRLEAMCWGAGTALGELPPYFMARAARLSGYDPDDETETELKELEDLERKLKNKEQMTIMEKLKVSVEMVVERVGFLGILACASVSTFLILIVKDSTIAVTSFFSLFNKVCLTQLDMKQVALSQQQQQASFSASSSLTLNLYLISF